MQQRLFDFIIILACIIGLVGSLAFAIQHTWAWSIVVGLMIVLVVQVKYWYQS